MRTGTRSSPHPVSIEGHHGDGLHHTGRLIQWVCRYLGPPSLIRAACCKPCNQSNKNQALHRLRHTFPPMPEAEPHRHSFPLLLGFIVSVTFPIRSTT
jgi:hypothetical protein